MKSIGYIINLIVGVVAGMWLCRLSYAPERVVDVQKDTIIVRDTVVVEKPTEIRTEYVAEKILVEVKDTLWIHDTLYISIPRERKFYKEEEFYAEVSGYKPSLDYIEVYPERVYVTKTERVKEKKNYLAVGVEAGWCVTPSIPIYLEYTRKLHKNVEFNAGVFHDLVLGETGFRIGVNANIGW
jgi:hypothetical protein